MLNLNNSGKLVNVVATKLRITDDSLISILQSFDKYPRVYHSSDHIVDLFERILNFRHPKAEEKLLLLTALFHDYVYDPKAKDNEKQSAQAFVNWCVDNNYVLDKGEGNLVYNAILDTYGHVPRSYFSEMFCYYDLSGFAEPNDVLWENELKIRKEYAWVDWDDYKKGKLDFIAKYRETPIAKTHLDIQSGMDWIARQIEAEKAPNIAVYAGSFNPFHVGHKNILEKAEKIFDKVIIAQGINPDKKEEPNYFKSKDIAACVQSEFEDSNPVEYLNYHQYDIYSTSLVEYLNGKGYNPTLVRGLRNTIDLQTEIQQSRWLQALKPDIKIVNIVCDAEFEHISSSAIRAVEDFDDLSELAQEYIVK